MHQVLAQHPEPAPTSSKKAPARPSSGGDKPAVKRNRSGGRKRGIGPAHRTEKWAYHDARSAEGKLLATVRKQLVEHIGGSPSVSERLIIDRAAWLVVHVSKMDAKALKNAGMSPHAAREYLAWVNTLRRVLAQLGLKARKGVEHDDLAGLLGGP